MPQMKPLNWLIIFFAIIFSLATLISFLYFFTCPMVPSTPRSSRPGSLWSWKW